MTVDPNTRLKNLRRALDQLTDELLREQPPEMQNRPEVIQAVHEAALLELDDFVVFEEGEAEALKRQVAPAPATLPGLNEKAHEAVQELWAEGLDVDAEPIPPHAEVSQQFLDGLAARSSGPGELSSQVEGSYGRPLPTELRRLLEAMGDGPHQLPRFGEWTPRVQPPWADFVSWVNEQQLEPFSERLFIEYFADLLFSGDAINGDLFYTYVGAGENGKAEVWCLDHSEGRLLVPAEADSLDTFAFQNWLAETAKSSTLGAGLEEAAAELVGKSSMGFHFSTLKKLLPGGVSWEKSYEEKTPVRRLVERARPWMSLLRSGEVKPAAFKADAARIGDQKPDWAAIRNNVPEALYWLCRSFFLQDESLAEGLRVLRDSRPPILRSAAEAFAELDSGKTKTLGKLDDVPALREQVRAAVGR